MSFTPKRKAVDPLTKNSPKRSRMDLSSDRKRMISKYSVVNIQLTQEDLARHFSLEFKLQSKIGRSTISEIRPMVRS